MKPHDNFDTVILFRRNIGIVLNWRSEPQQDPRRGAHGDEGDGMELLQLPAAQAQNHKQGHGRPDRQPAGAVRQLIPVEQGRLQHAEDGGSHQSHRHRADDPQRGLDIPVLPEVIEHRGHNQNHNHRGQHQGKGGQHPAQQVSAGGGDANVGNVKDRDPLFEEAARFIVMSNTASTSSLQRRYEIGYNRAGRLMDQMEHAGIVGPAQGSKPRQVLVSPMDIDQLFTH